MAEFDTWCDGVVSKVGTHYRIVFTVQAAKRGTGIVATAAILPGHYASEERIAHALQTLGKVVTAKVIKTKLPTVKAIRSGDLGEILATEWIAAHGQGYQAPIKRLRWKDHRNMAMRGEDVIALRQDSQTGRLQFLKTEAKSRLQLTAQVLIEARAGLDKDDGLPSAHALEFIADRLFEQGQEALAGAITNVSLNVGIAPQDVGHLLFTLSGNAPTNLLTASLNGYVGTFHQWAVGIHVDDHANFISSVYEQVIANAEL